MIAVDSDSLELSTRLADVGLLEGWWHSIIPGSKHIKRSELAVVGDVLRSCVQSAEGGGFKLGNPVVRPLLWKEVEESDGGGGLGVAVPVDLACAFEAEPCWRDLANVWANARELGDERDVARELNSMLAYGY